MKIAIIPARGGSTRIPRKNTRFFHGKPIIAYSIETALGCEQMFDHVIVSSDDESINSFASRYNVTTHLRSPELADNDVGTQEVARDVILWAEKALNKGEHLEHACVIYATAPMLERSDLWRGWEQVNRHGRHYAFSVGTDPLQDAGQFYFGAAKAFIERRPLIGPLSAMIPIESARCCDINTQQDWERAEEMYEKLKSS